MHSCLNQVVLFYFGWSIFLDKANRAFHFLTPSWEQWHGFFWHRHHHRHYHQSCQRGSHAPYYPNPFPLPTYAFACSSLNELLMENMQITSQFSFLCYIRLQNFWVKFTVLPNGSATRTWLVQFVAYLGTRLILSGSFRPVFMTVSDEETL